METKKEFWRTVKFTLFSISAGVIQIAVCSLLNELLSIPYWVAYLISLVASVLWNFTLNRKYTFQSATSVPIAMMKVACYYLVFTPLSTAWSAYLTEPDFGIMLNEYIVLAITLLINFTTEYLFQRLFVFGKTLDTLKK